MIPGIVPRGVRNPLHFTLAARLKKARLAANVRPTILSRKVGLSAPTVTNIERGGVPGVDVVEKLARGLSVSACLLAYGVQPGAVLTPGEPLHCLDLGERLRAAREQAGLSKSALGKLAGYSHTAIGNIESAKVLPGVDVAEALATALKISPCWLAFAEGEPRGPRFPPPIKKKRSLAPRRITKTAMRRGR